MSDSWAFVQFTKMASHMWMCFDDNKFVIKEKTTLFYYYILIYCVADI